MLTEMKRNRMRLVALGMLAFSMNVGCGAEADSEDSDDVADALDETAGGKTDLFRWIAGKYSLVNANMSLSVTAFEKLNLESDGKYEARIYCPECMVIPQKGTYKLLRKGQRTYIEFSAKDETTGEVRKSKYQYTRVSFDKMELREVGKKVKFQMEREVNDCRQTGCRAGTNCQICWYNYACVPEGAMC